MQPRSMATFAAVLPLLAVFAAAGRAVAVDDAAPAEPPPAKAKPAPSKPDGPTPPAIFDTRPYEEARRAAEAEGRWFIVKGTAPWCIPCRRMDRTTWVDPDVVAWLEANAVVYPMDIDRERAKAVSLRIESVPTIVAFKDGAEFDRVIGAMQARPFLDWLEGLERGERSLAAAPRQPAGPAPPGGEAEVRARYEKARALAGSRTPADQARGAEAFEWLWRNADAHHPAFSSVRTSFVAGDMKQLARRSAEAKARFTALRDETSRLLDDGPIDPRLLDEWIVLNDVIGEQATTLAWFDRVKVDPRWQPLFARSAQRLVDLLEANDRWADLGALIDDPVDAVQRDHGMMSIVRQGMRAGEQERPNDVEMAVAARLWHSRAGRIYAGVLADGRDEGAREGALEAMRLDPTPAMLEALVRRALDAGQPRSMQLEWIDAALARSGMDGADAALTPAWKERLQRLRRDVERRLAEASGATPRPGETAAP